MGGMLMTLLALGSQAEAQAQVSVSDSGRVGYTFSIAVPPGIAGMAPAVGLQYDGDGANGPMGPGWGISGVSMITRCPTNKMTDGVVRAVQQDVHDKLCLDGQRLIQTDANGAVVNGAVSNPSVGNPLQQNDSAGGSGMVREYRTERDTFARVRAYGAAGGSADGPAYFKVWTKSGQVFEYGDNSNATANANITA